MKYLFANVGNMVLIAALMSLGSSSCDPIINAKVVPPAQAEEQQSSGNPGELDKPPAKALRPIAWQMYGLAIAACTAIKAPDIWECGNEFLECYPKTEMKWKDIEGCVGGKS